MFLEPYFVFFIRRTWSPRYYTSTSKWVLFCAYVCSVDSAGAPWMPDSQLVCPSLGDGVQSWLNKPRKSGASKRVKKYTLRLSRLESSRAEVSWSPQQGLGPCHWASNYIQDLPGEDSMCEHEKHFRVGRQRQVMTGIWLFFANLK